MLITSITDFFAPFLPAAIAILAASLAPASKSPATPPPMPEVSPDPAAFAQSLGFTLEPQQRAILAADPHRVLVVGSRQWGKSLTASIKALHVALTQPGSHTVIAAPSERQSGFLIDRIARLAARFRLKKMRVPGFTRSLELPNGSRIVAVPQNRDSIRGISDVNLLIIDEAAFVDDDFYVAIRPTLTATNGHLWLLSTPNRPAGFFYEEHLDRANWSYFKIPASDCPRISKDFLAEQRRKLGPADFDREYLCIFGATSSPVFDLSVFERTERPETNTSQLQPSTYYAGVDLGQMTTPAALVILREVSWYSRDIDPVTGSHKLHRKLFLHTARTFPLYTAYSDLISEIQFAVERLPRHREEHTELIVDATGLGGPVVEMFRDARIDQSTLRPVVITNGQDPTYSHNIQRIPRPELFSSASIVLTDQNFAIADSATGAQDLRAQLSAIELTPTDSGPRHSSKSRDDLVLAFALAAWHARKCLRT